MKKKVLAYFDADIDVRRLVRYRYKAAGRLSVHCDGSCAFKSARAVFYAYAVGRSAEPAHTAERIDAVRQARIDAKSVEFRPDPEYILAGRYERPRCRSGEPAVFAFSVRRGISARNRLTVGIWLCAVYLADILEENRIGLAIDVECAAAVPQHCLRYNYPWIAVTEYAGVLLVTWRI